MKTLTVGELRQILNYIPDDVEVVIIDENIPTEVVRVTQIGYLVSDYEEHDAIGLAADPNIKEITGLCRNYLFDGRNKDEIEEVS
jgi:hypothetical protein